MWFFYSSIPLVFSMYHCIVVNFLHQSLLLTTMYFKCCFSNLVCVSALGLMQSCVSFFIRAVLCSAFCMLLKPFYKNWDCMCTGYQTKMHLYFKRFSLSCSLFVIYGELHSFPGICFICLTQPRGSMLSGTTERRKGNIWVFDSFLKDV